MTHKIRTTKTHVVIELSSRLGRKYEVGYPIEDGYTEKEVLESFNANKKLAESFLKVEWVPGAPQTSPSREVRERGIEAGYVSHDRGSIYEYRINFQNSKGWGFDFKDETDDVYSCSTIRNGWHYIDYNSDKATIVGIA
ncbi:hypothetical protein RZO07_16930 [Pseudomonas protegens]|uniref:hypothetical protein n=1 Tax=Pseudomonas protegens TaxID=380021 RepID=UPI00293717F3|nr:hypothetical protein [Pseudomonas protegens]WOE77024.1 hypothetical protein RZO07_16930 [Pseudomonas protegens]